MRLREHIEFEILRILQRIERYVNYGFVSAISKKCSNCNCVLDLFNSCVLDFISSLHLSGILKTRNINWQCEASRYYLCSGPTVELTRNLFIIVDRQYNNSCFSSCPTHLQPDTICYTHIYAILTHDLPFQKLDKLHWLPGSGGRELPLHHQPGADLYRYIDVDI